MDQVIAAALGMSERELKPCGTGRALLSCLGLLDGPFTGINADDYYGKHAYVQAQSFMEGYDPAEPFQYGDDRIRAKEYAFRCGQRDPGLVRCG